MHTQSVAQLSQLLSQGTVSSTELTEHFLKRIESLDSDINSFITVNRDGALKQAQMADKQRADGLAGPLTGVPIAHKDIFCTQGIKTTCASRMLENFIPPYESTVTANIAAAGMVNLGKTNMDEFAMGSSNETSFFGASRNPWNTNHIPGGSSGGSAAAVAAALAPIATGTDTGGSIRQPAAHTGLTGIKPTYGSVSRWGMIAFASSLDQAGPMATSAEDAALLLNTMVSHDNRDSTSVAHPNSDFLTKLNTPISGLRIGVPASFFSADLDSEVGDAIQLAISQLQQQGAVIVPISLEMNQHALSAYYVIAPSEASANLSRFDGVRFGHRCEDPKDLKDLYSRSRSEGFGAEVQTRILVGTYALSAGYYDAYYRKAQKLRRLIKDDFEQAFKQVDVILAPTTPSTACKLGEKFGDPAKMYLEDIYTLAVNLAGLPAMSLPCGMAKGLPIGMQLIGPAFGEANILHLGHQFQQHSDWHKQRAPIALQEVSA
ncbi:Asp-tRNA(Asn)/Glu-tRNA(Gln) amidotransferase subunit GatA [Umboniibacter marinipuniceus]|uniref:Asp-tRNA(Asn)/Glu-tRNA(Gln) amidotransferase subunit GatA n=1 Tax=Umboniibacter marinipuniceus TaxID=569599 RepID=UPI000EF8649E|nr:Asp-tRNA(Asn)/Glu-tRNA(Gln) amidotransferase subunit GatA [Umboniibacter marinipuniceus]